MRTTASVVIGLALLAAALASSRGHAQESQNVLPALLAEVRGLRAAMEQMAAAGPRVQLALGRLQLQEQRVNTLVRRLETVREAVAAAQREYFRHQDQVAQVEAVLKDPANPDREHVSKMIEGSRRDLARSAAEVQRLTAEESSVAADIASGQARWTDFNQRLEELERALARQ